MKLKKILSVFFIVLSSTVHSQTVLTGGPVGGEWTMSGSPYLVTGDIIVPVDSVLIIDPGVNIIFNEYCGLTITGRLFAQGTAGDSIIFTASDTNLGWDALTFSNHGLVYPDTSILDYCKIEYGRPHFYLPNNHGGGLHFYYTQFVVIRNSVIRKCYTARGGGVYLETAIAILFDKVIIEDNYASIAGGGVYCMDADADFKDVIFQRNKSRYFGGALYLDERYLSLENVKILNNKADKGGGIFIKHLWNGGYTSFINCKIIKNEAYTYGGGMYIDENYMYEGTLLYFDGTSIYMNYSGHAADIYYARESTLNLPLDTFTLKNADEYIRYGELALVAQTYLLGEQTNNEIYVSPQGSDQNTGDAQHPLFTVNAALRKVKASSTNPGNIHLAEGLYSPGSNGEYFPFFAKDFVTLTGERTDLTILDAQNTGNVMMITESSSALAENITISGGKKDEQRCGTLYISNSDPIFNHCKFNYNDTLYANEDYSVGIYGQSFPHFSFCTFTNQKIWGHSEIYIDSGSPKFEHCEFLAPEYIIGQEPESKAITSFSSGYVYISDVLFLNHASAVSMGTHNILNSCLFQNNLYGIVIWEFDNQSISNCTFIDNVIPVLCRGDLDIQNSLFYNYNSINPQNIILEPGIYDYPSTLKINYSDIEGGQNSIIVLDTISTLIWGEGNIDSDPLYENPDSNQFWLSSSSPCIDAGNPDTTGLHLPESDLAGYPRFYGPGIDIGAYEWFPVEVDEKTYSEKSSMGIFPNPADSYIFFQLRTENSTSAHSIKIYNSAGQLIETIKVPVGMAPFPHLISNYPCGLYYSVLHDGYGPVCITKFTVVR